MEDAVISLVFFNKTGILIFIKTRKTLFLQRNDEF